MIPGHLGCTHNHQVILPSHSTPPAPTPSHGRKSLLILFGTPKSWGGGTFDIMYTPPSKPSAPPPPPDFRPCPSPLECIKIPHACSHFLGKGGGGILGSSFPKNFPRKPGRRTAFFVIGYAFSGINLVLVTMILLFEF